MVLTSISNPRNPASHVPEICFEKHDSVTDNHAAKFAFLRGKRGSNEQVIEANRQRIGPTSAQRECNPRA